MIELTRQQLKATGFPIISFCETKSYAEWLQNENGPTSVVVMLTELPSLTSCNCFVVIRITPK